MGRMKDEMMQQAEVELVTKLSRATLWRLRTKGEFPRPALNLGRKNLWRRSEVQGWIAGTWRPTA